MAARIPSQPLCSACKSIFAPGSFELWQSWYDQHPGDVDGFPRKFHSSQQDLRDAVAADCWICTQITCEEEFSSVDHFDYAFLRCDDCSQYAVKFYPIDDGESNWEYDFRKLHIWRHDMPDSLYDAAARSRACSWMGQPDVLNLASEWLKGCQDSHQCCAQANYDWHPSRLLDVSVDGTIRLVTTAEEHVTGYYATLSHCWGPEKFLVLEPDNISQFSAGYPLEEIPRTFQEAVQVIRHLKIRYLWIDSYCIIQGDSDDAREDWNREAQKMCSVYTNSFLNIGSAYSKNPHGGLFQQHMVDELLDNVLLKWQPSAVDDESFYNICIDPERGFHPLYEAFEHLSECALSKRAWVIQEMVLSPRMLTFTSNQLIWQCSEAAACENAPAQGRKSILEVEQWSSFWSAGNDVPPSNREDCIDEMPKLMRRWFHISTKYGEAELSYPVKDRLKALAGVGEHFSRLCDRTYRYGILDGTLPQALLWTAPKKSWPRSLYRPTGIAPSWHWASHEHAVYLSLNFARFDELYNPTSAEPLAHTFLQEHDVSSDVEATTNTTITIDWPILIFIGRILELPEDGLMVPPRFHCTLRLPNDISSLDKSIRTYGIIDAGRFDSPDDFPREGVRLLPLIYKNRSIWAMLLRVEESGYYSRLGIFEISWSGDRIGRAIQKRLLERKPSLIIVK